MRIGLTEIIVIVVIIIAIPLIARILRAGRRTAREDEESSKETPGDQFQSKKNARRSFLTRTGVAFIVAGGILLVAGMSMFRFALQNYWWAFIFVVIGLVVFLFSKKK